MKYINKCINYLISLTFIIGLISLFFGYKPTNSEIGCGFLFSAIFFLDYANNKC